MLGSAIRNGRIQRLQLQLLRHGQTGRVTVRYPSTRGLFTLQDTRDRHTKKQEGLTPTELSQQLKELLRCVPHALTIVTAVSEDDSKPTGLLVSSFNSVTLYPIPYISFNIKVPSATLEVIRSSGHFTASIIDSPYTADVFAQQVDNANDLKGDLLRPNGKLEDGNGGVLWMKCKWSRKDVIEVGDHAIMVGEVLDFGSYHTKDMAEGAMMYWHGHYMFLGQHTKRTLLGTSSQRTKIPGRIHSGTFRKVTWPPNSGGRTVHRSGDTQEIKSDSKPQELANSE